MLSGPSNSCADSNSPLVPAAPPAKPVSVRAARLLDAVEEMPAGVVIEAITNHKLDPTCLNAARRQDCVHHLIHMGFTNDEVARFLRVNDRTITRDRQAIRKNRALTIASSGPSHSPPQLETRNSELETSSPSTTPAELLGEFQSIAMASIQRLTTLARDPRTPAYTRLAAEEAITRTYQKFITLAERLGTAAPSNESTNELPTLKTPSRRAVSQATATLLIAINSGEAAERQAEVKCQTIDVPRLEAKA